MEQIEEPVEAVTPPGTGRLLYVRTVSGAVYEIDVDGMMLRRRPHVLAAEAAVACSDLRRDGEWLAILEIGPTVIGQPMVVLLEPLGDPLSTNATQRVTTAVAEVAHVGTWPEDGEGRADV